MDKDRKELTAEEISAMTKDWNVSSDSNWIWVLVLMAIFACSWGSGTDLKSKEDIAELKGKVSVLEQLAVAERRA